LLSIIYDNYCQCRYLRTEQRALPWTRSLPS
jgi:hypothetical protein